MSVWIVVLLVLAVVAVAVGVWFLLRFLAYRKGTLGKSRVDALLKKFGVIRNYKILRDVTLTSGSRKAQIDHLLIGFFGVLFVSTVNDTAEYYGTVKDRTWTKVTAKSREKMENLERRNMENIDVVREIFSRQGVYNIKMEGVVVFCGNRKKMLLGVTGSPSLMNFKDFKTYLYKSKFEKDNDVDVPALYEILKQHIS